MELQTCNCKLKNLLLKVSNTASASRFSLLDWETTGYESAWGLPYRSLMVARIINLKNIWLFLSTRSLVNSSTSKDNHTKWIVEELHVFSTPPSRSFKRRISRSPPTNVARVRILASTPYVGWVCCWFSPLLREVFLRVLRFSPLLKNQHFQIPIRCRTQVPVSTSS